MDTLFGCERQLANTSTSLHGQRPLWSELENIVDASYRCERRLVLVYISRRMGRSPMRLRLIRHLLRVIAVAAPAVCATFSSPQPEKPFVGPWVIVVEPAPR